MNRLIQRHALRTLVCAAGMCLALGGAVRADGRDAARPQIDANTVYSVAQNVKLFSAPAEAPPIAESDYRSYFGKGTGQLIVPMVVSLRNGTKVVLADVHHVLAYPDTPFTRWMLEKYAQHVNGIYLNDDRNSYPGQARTGIAVPPYLAFDSMFDHPERSAVRQASSCDVSTGECSFNDLPAGKYLIFENEYVYQSESRQHTYLEPYLDFLVEHHYATTQERALCGFVLIGGAYEVQDRSLARPLQPVSVAAFYYLPQAAQP